MSIHDYSKTPASNSAIDGTSVAENCSPAGLNDAIRALMADVKQYIEDVGGGLASAGSANAYTVTTNATWAAYADNLKIAIQANHTNTGAATLNVDSLGAKAIKKFTSSGVADVAADDIQSGATYALTYDGTNGYFVLFGSTGSHNHSGVYEPADADILKADTHDTLTAGFDSDAEAVTLSGTVTLEVDANTKENYKTGTNSGAFTLAAPSTSSSCTIVLQVTNDASAGAITFSGFNKQDGDDLTTTNGDDFFIIIVKVGSFISATVKALQ